ncbi:MAG: energy transducer TonB [Fimbriimonadaceae bacterium]|nr:energy transducer TonB [Fimbriimonadaceae bacterium]
MVTPPVLKSKVEADYSDDARETGLSGSVLLTFIIDQTGLPTQIKVMRPLGLGLDQNALVAMRQWRV